MTIKSDALLWIRRESDSSSRHLVCVPLRQTQLVMYSSGDFAKHTHGKQTFVFRLSYSVIQRRCGIVFEVPRRLVIDSNVGRQMEEPSFCSYAPGTFTPTCGGRLLAQATNIGTKDVSHTLLPLSTSRWIEDTDYRGQDPVLLLSQHTCFRTSKNTVVSWQPLDDDVLTASD